MNADLIFEILDLAMSLAEAQVDGTLETNFTTASTLKDIIQKSAVVLHQHTGEAVDPALIKTEAEI